jgi:hypothetical protein
MAQICHQTIQNRGNKAELLESGPVFGNGVDNYFGPGYYFWDNNVSQANWWGRIHYKGSYYVFEALVEIDKNEMFDTTDRSNIEFLEQAAKKFIENEVDISDFYLGNFISLLRDEEKALREKGKNIKLFPFLYARGLDNRRNTRRKMMFSKRTYDFFNLDPVVFFCIFDKENLALQRFELIQESGKPIIL